MRPQLESTYDQPLHLTQLGLAVVPSNNRIGAGESRKIKQLDSLGMVPCSEYDLDAAIAIVPYDGRKQRNVRRIIDIDPDRF